MGKRSMIGFQDQSATSGANTQSSDAIAAALAPVRARFCALIVQRLMVLESFRVDFNCGRYPHKALVGIIEIVHKIAGVAETLGFPAAGQLAATLEQSASDGFQRQAPAKEIWRVVEPQLIALMDELELLLDL